MPFSKLLQLAASAPIHTTLEFFSQYSAKYFFQATACFLTKPLLILSVKQALVFTCLQYKSSENTVG